MFATMILVHNRNNHEPYVHAAMEEYLLRHLDTSHHDYLLLYTNTSCVVVGKNQSIYQEVNIDYLRAEDSIIVRRISGGGTVYHDQGNVCFARFSQFHESKVNHYRYFNQPIIDALQRAGIPATYSSRNDIIWGDKKISGNAQFTDRKNIISHGTLLVNSDLTKLRSALKKNDHEVSSKAVKSVPSSVMNISEGSQRFRLASDLIDYLTEDLKFTDILYLNDTEWAAIVQLAREKFQSQQWIYGRNPTTVITKPEIKIVIEEGMIARLESIRLKASTIDSLIGVSYQRKAIADALSTKQIGLQNQQWLCDLIF